MSEQERPKIEVHGALTRCPYCHDTIDVAGHEWTACADCLARHHQGCWNELGRGGTCQSTTALEPSKQKPPAHEPRPKTSVWAAAVEARAERPIVLEQPFRERSPEREAWEREHPGSTDPMLALLKMVAFTVGVAIVVAVVYWALSMGIGTL